MHRLRSESGAVAIEFAIVLVPLILILTGILDFGSAYRSALSVTAAAREGARSMVVGSTVAAAKNATIAASHGLSPPLTPGQISISFTGGTPAATTTCTAGATVTVTVTYPLTSITGMFDSLLDGESVAGVGVMRCEK